ncbi:hypothetical protein LTR86_000528 [Recurvomyces mirabilis]|nr:hypothetical protein LTR86_000528 [Recurvomyces mirabilis]
MGLLSRNVEGPSIDDKWTDLEIRCHDGTFRVHRAIVCPKSVALAAQCEALSEAAHGIANVIEHYAFDAQTVEYMLHRMYEGDYSLAVDSTTDDRSSISMNSSDESFGQLVLVDQAEPSAYGDAVSHVHVYAIAQSYRIPKLQELALEKFACVDITQQLDDFAEVLYEVYKYTTDAADPLRKQALIMALDAIDSLVLCDNFMDAISLEPSLQDFAPTVLGAALRQAQSSAREETTELLGSLTLSTNGEIEALSSSYEEHLAELTAKLTKQEDTVDLLRDQVRIKTGEVGNLQSELKEVTGEKQEQSRQLARSIGDLQTRNDAFSAMKLELANANRALQMSNSISQVKQEKADEALQKLKQTDEKYKAAVNEANDLKQLHQQQAKEIERLITANQNVASSTAQVSALQAKVTQSTANLLTAKSMENAAKAMEWQLQDIIEDAVCRSTEWEKCRNGACMDDIGTYLDWDDRSGSNGHAVMLRCGNCRCRHYGPLFS